MKFWGNYRLATLLVVVWSAHAPLASAEIQAEQERSLGVADFRALLEDALEAYADGQVADAKLRLDSLLIECESRSSSECPLPVRARVHIARGIVLCYQGDLPLAEFAFERATVLDPGATIPAHLITEDNRKILLIARQKVQQRQACLSCLQSSMRATRGAEPEWIPESTWNQDSAGGLEPTDRFPLAKPKSTIPRVAHGFVLLEAQAGSGFAEGQEATKVGAGATLGGRPGSHIAFAGRVHASWLAPLQRDGNAAIGASALSGLVWGPPGASFGYLLGGGGLESYLGRASPGALALVGASFGHTVVGVGVETGWGVDRYSFLTLQLGYGSLF